VPGVGTKHHFCQAGFTGTRLAKYTNMIGLSRAAETLVAAPEVFEPHGIKNFIGVGLTEVKNLRSICLQ